MRAARFHTAGDVRIEDVPAPGAVAARELLVRVRECGICGTDLHEYAAGPIVTPVEPHPLTGAQNPQILGHEFAGEVVAVGEGVTRVKVGDRVVGQIFTQWIDGPFGWGHAAQLGFLNELRQRQRRF